MEHNVDFEETSAKSGDKVYESFLKIAKSIKIEMDKKTSEKPAVNPNRIKIGVQNANQWGNNIGSCCGGN